MTEHSVGRVGRYAIEMLAESRPFGECQVWEKTMNYLTPEGFPLRAIGTLIYAKNWSSPVLTAMSPEDAELTVEWLNKFHAIGGAQTATDQAFGIGKRSR